MYGLISPVAKSPAWFLEGQYREGVYEMDRQTRGKIYVHNNL